MKIGIFGDSYASQPSQSNPSHLQWWQYVQQQCPNIKITNHTHGGSALHYTWKQFHAHQHKYDKVIVCVTNNSRLWLPHLPRKWDMEHISNTDMFAYRKFDPSVTKLMKKAVTLYYHHIINDAEAQDLWKLRVDNMKNTNLNALYLDCFYNDAPCSDWIPLYYISLLDGDINGWKDPRANHFNDTNSRIFAQKIIKWIETNQFSLNITDFSKS